MKKLYFLLLLLPFLFAHKALAAPSITGDAPILSQGAGGFVATPFDTNTFPITAGKTYLLVLKGAVWQTVTETVTVTTSAGSTLTWTQVLPVDCSQTVITATIWIATAVSSNATEQANITEHSVGFFHSVYVDIYEINNYNGIGATMSSSSAAAPTNPSLFYAPSTTNSYLFETAIGDAHGLTAQPEWTQTSVTTTNFFSSDARQTTLTTSTASRTLAPANAGSQNGWSMEAIELLNTAAPPTVIPQPYLLFISGWLRMLDKPLIIY